MTEIPSINHDRLATNFQTLCEIDSPSRSELQVAEFLIDFFSQHAGVQIFQDSSRLQTNSNTDNLIVRIPGNRSSGSSIFFACHMDVISPCLGVQVVFSDNIFTSKGDTVLGGDDKAGIAILMEIFLLLVEHNIPHCPLEFVFTTCEEIGLLGAKALNTHLLQSRFGYALDSTGVDNVIYGAPAAVSLHATIHGKASHAGLNPEEGISAIFLASQIISRLPLGRLDKDSTANIGLIKGGNATNIIPASVEIKGEIRSHSPNKMSKHIFHLKQIFHEVMLPFHPAAHYLLDIEEEYPALHLANDSPPIKLCQSAAHMLHRSLNFIIAGGGSDANIFNHHGLETAILGIGMKDVHSTSESISLTSMVRSAELCLSLVTS